MTKKNDAPLDVRRGIVEKQMTAPSPTLAVVKLAGGSLVVKILVLAAVALAAALAPHAAQAGKYGDCPGVSCLLESDDGSGQSSWPCGVDLVLSWGDDGPPSRMISVVVGDTITASLWMVTGDGEQYRQPVSFVSVPVWYGSGLELVGVESNYGETRVSPDLPVAWDEIGQLSLSQDPPAEDPGAPLVISFSLIVRAPGDLRLALEPDAFFGTVAEFDCRCSFTSPPDAYSRGCANTRVADVILNLRSTPVGTEVTRWGALRTRWR